MQYFTVEGKNYDEAVKKASDLYGVRLRIHSRKDITRGGFLGSSHVVGCEITCYLSEPDPEPAPERKPEPAQPRQPEQVQDFHAESAEGIFKPQNEMPSMQKPEERESVVIEPAPEIEINVAPQHKADPVSGQIDLFPSDGKVSQELLDYADALLKANDFSPAYCQWIKEELEQQLQKALPDVPSKSDIQLSLADKIAYSIEIDHKSQVALPACTVLVGAQGCGKTTTVAKLAAIYAQKKDACIVSCDDSANAWDQAQKLSNALKVPACKGYNPEMLAEAAQSCKTKEITLVDGKGIPLSSNVDCGDMSELSKLRPRFWIVVSAATKNSDLAKVFKMCEPLGLKGAVVTKMDETSTVGNVISICHDYGIPLVFLSDGRRIPRDFSKATVFTLLSRLTGFSVDFTQWARKES